MVNSVVKRDGRTVPFKQERITNAIFKAAQAVGGEDRERAVLISTAVVDSLNAQFTDDNIPSVEQIQDTVEKILVAYGHAKTAKAFILYRDLHSKLRDIHALIDANELVQGYLDRLDWRVNENSNMSYSLQGLNNHIFTAVNNAYWLNQLYPRNIRNAHMNGDIHIHDLYLLAAYCCGWSLEDLLLRGFGGVPGKLECSPPRHFRSALGQIANFLYTVQGEVAGAVAISSFDTLLAPYVWADDLEYDEVKQAMQEFIFNMNVPTRVGFQCFSEDTEILTSYGWRSYQDVKVDDAIATYNPDTEIIEYLPVLRMFSAPYSGIMYNLKNRVNDQLISPGHRVVRRGFNNNKKITIQPIEQVLEYNSPVCIPLLTGGNSMGSSELNNDLVRIAAWIISDGTWDKTGRGFGRITIFQNKDKHPDAYQEIIEILDRLELVYSINDSTTGFGSVTQIRIDTPGSRQLVESLWKTSKDQGLKFIPECILNADTRLSRLFIETYLKGDGDTIRVRTSTASKEIRDGLIHVGINAGFMCTVFTREFDGHSTNKQDLYVINFLRSENTYIQRVREVPYEGIIWCPTTKNDTVIARRNGKTFITGNTPFSNITMDVQVPAHLADGSVVLAGAYNPHTYGEFQEQVNMINRAFAEVMLEGDASGRVFTFPIPTYNITADFEWNNPSLDAMWQMTGKYGIPYFANFVNSNMNLEDTRSMCCRLHINTSELNKRGGGLFGSNPLTGSLGVVTLNMARIGYTSDTDEEFLNRVAELMDIARDSLLLKRQVIEGFTEKGLYPYSKYYLNNVKRRFDSYWANHFNTIGVIGMNEALRNFMNVDLTSEVGRAFTLHVLDFMRKRLLAYQEETGQMFNLEATPGEGASYRLALLDKERFPNAFTAGQNVPYYTNSTQLPVDATDDLFEALGWQDEIQTQYTGGTVFHAYLGESLSNTTLIKQVVRTIALRFRLPYFTITPTFSICPEHGYITGEHFTCPTCESDCEVYSRVVGYIRPVKQWNRGKQAEFAERKSFETMRVAAVPKE